MKVTNSETVAHDDGKPMKKLDLTTTTKDDDYTMVWVEPATQASEGDHTSCPQIYRLMTDAQLPAYTKFTVETSLLSPVTKEVSPSGGVDLNLTQKLNSDIQLMLKILSGKKSVTRPVNFMSTFSKNFTKIENALIM